MKPYSLDFRQKVVSTYHAGNISVRKLAANFGVGKAFVQKMLKQHQQKGHVNPGKQGGAKITSDRTTVFGVESLAQPLCQENR